MTLQPGTRLGPYEVVSPIGAGGMGEVYRGRDTRLDRTVAIKVLPAEFEHDARFKIRFAREAKAISALNHPHICTLFDVGDSYLVMEYCEGKTLAARIGAGPLPLAETIEYAIQMAQALEKAHSRGIIHRDLKPANVMVTESGVKLLDFGLAKERLEATSRTTTLQQVTEEGSIVGTIQYMAPELLNGRRADARSDLFALGVMLYEMLTGEPAFRGATKASLIASILEHEPRPISKLKPDIPPALERLVRSCIVKDPDARIQTAREVASQLLSVRENSHRPWLGRATRGASIAALAALLAGGSWWSWTRFHSAVDVPIHSLVILPLENRSGPGQEYFAAGMYDSMIGQLAQISALRLISRTSAMHYKDSRKSLPEIARELNVDGVVEGSVFRSGDAIRIQVALVRARPEERQIWAQTFDRDYQNVLTLQSEVARAIADTIKIRLTPQEAMRLTTKRSINPQTYDAYLKGTFYVNKLTPEDIVKGIAYLKEAVEKDPNEPFAYAALALACTTAAHGPLPTAESFLEAKVLASKAVQLDETMAEAHEALGAVHAYYEFDWAGAAREFRRALELNPNLAIAHRNNGFCLQLAGRRDEGIAELIRAKELDPLSPLYRAELGWHYWSAGQLQKAREEVQSAVQLEPNFGMGQAFFTTIAADMGRSDESVAAARKASGIRPGWKYALAYAYAKAGRRDEARAIAAEIAQKPLPISGWGLAEVYAALGDRQETMRWLEYGVKARFSWMPWIRRNPTFRRFYDDPQFVRIARQMNIPE